MDRYKKLSAGQTPGSVRSLSHNVYRIVELTTEQFKERLAHFAKTDYDASLLGSFIEDLEIALNTEDIKELKGEILSEDSIVSGKLKEIVKNLNN